jgi:hypothetical protein
MKDLKDCSKTDECSSTEKVQGSQPKTDECSSTEKVQCTDKSIPTTSPKAE